MALVGDKLAARRLAVDADVPVIPGMMAEADDANNIIKEVEKIGYPVLLKAAGGGGGKGMRIANNEDELSHGLEAAQREAMGAFGDPRVYVEKYIQKPRHIEFQVLADKYGNAIHLFERECSIQRRHQKIIEESPSIALDDELRERMGTAALSMVKASNYCNAGTVEFLLDIDGSFYFLEVNARIQVEHPVTELVTGFDLVSTQLKLAAGEKLDIDQDTVNQRGHAIECRIYAEDPANNFLPSSGEIAIMTEPSGPGVRLDTGFREGDEVSVFYDPIISKLIVWGPDRESAISRMRMALNEYTIGGISTIIPFLRDVISHSAYREGLTYTDFIGVNLSDWTGENQDNELTNLALCAAAASSTNNVENTGVDSGMPSPWTSIGSWKIGGE
jgi:acetyl/propionyl-CoA carboxylase alpha subunit